MTEMERNNKAAMTAHLVDVIVMLTFVLLQVPSGLASWTYLLVMVILGMTPVIIEYYFWRRDHDTIMIKHLAAVGFAVFYTFTLFTAANSLVFAFVIPMILIVTIYNDEKYIVIINCGTVLESFLVTIIGAKTGKFGYSGRDNAIIQVVVMILVAIYAYSSAKTLNRNSRQKLNSIESAQQETQLVLNDISELSQQLKKGIEDIDSGLNKLSEVSLTTRNAMQEVSSGAADTADAVQRQMRQTEAIQVKVDKVNDAAEGITENMQQTLSALEEGHQNVGILVEKADASVHNGEEVAVKLKNLDEYMQEMNSIVELIGGITSQTSLLALNASIEAARAGEAGKGFSVVASEISGMATQTKNATQHITELIDNVSKAINEVVSVVYQMIEGINEERQSTDRTADSFEIIQSNTTAIRDNVDQLAANITELRDANQEIVDSIQTISAISEQVTAHAGETVNAQEENEVVLGKIEKRMQELLTLIKA